MARLWSQDSLQPPLPTTPVIVDTNWLETVPGPAKTMDIGMALPQSVNLVSKISITKKVNYSLSIVAFIKCVFALISR